MLDLQLVVSATFSQGQQTMSLSLYDQYSKKKEKKKEKEH